MLNMPALPYWRLSNFYFFYFASLGALAPYLGLYLHSLHFNPEEIGELVAVTMATRIIAPNIWGWIADHLGKHIILVRFGSILAFLCFTGIFFYQTYLGLAITLGIFSFFWNAILPQIEVTTLAYLDKNTYYYSYIRLWGSVGFVVAVAILGWVFEKTAVTVFPFIIFGIFLVISFSSFFIPEYPTQPITETKQSLRHVLRHPKVLILLLVCFLMQASHGPYYTFYTLYLEEYHYSRTFIGQLWALGVIAEVIAFLFMHRLIHRFGLRFLLLTSLVLTAIRWLLIGYGVEWVSILLFAQLLHAASFGLYHGVSIHFIHRYFTGRLRGRGQALYSSISFGVGGAISSLMSGYTWNSMGAQFNYTFAALACMIALWLTWHWVGHE